MYTQCPDCQTAFRVTAEVLQKAAGRVRCGGCGNAFSAIDFLSESLPNSVSPAGSDSAVSASIEGLDEKSKELLQTLDELAGPKNVRIEDTGIEWRVLADNEDSESEDEDIVFEDSSVVEAISQDSDPLADSGAQTSLNLQQLVDGEMPVNERRYDDNTPLPDNFDDEENIPYSAPVEPEQRRADDDPDDSTEFDTHQIDLAMSADEDWAELLDADDDADNMPIVSAEAGEERENHQEQTDSSDSPLTTELDDANAPQTANDSALLPELAAELAGDLSDTSRTARSEIPLEVEEELAAIHSELAAGAAMISRGPAMPPTRKTDDDHTIDSTGGLGSEQLSDDVESAIELSLDDAEPDADIDTDVTDEPAADQIVGKPGDEGETAIDLSLDDSDGTDGEGGADVDMYLDDTDDVDEEADTGVIDLSEELDDEEFDFEDELTPDEEANIVEKLRESTGAFQKQIEAARAALERGEAAEYSEPVYDLDDEAEDEPKEISDDRSSNDDTQVNDTLDDRHDEDAADAPSSLETIDESADGDDSEEDVAHTLEDETDLELEDSEEDGTRDESDSDDDERDAEDDGELAAASVAKDTAQTADDILSQTMIQAGIDPSQLDSENAETIIMEGEFVRSALDEQQLAEESEALAQISDGDSLIDTYMLNKGKVRGGRRRSDPAGYAMIAGIVVLIALLAVQFMHASRSDFATYGAFNQTVGPVYRALGRPVTPEWDVKGWRFETTNGSVDEEQQVLTIVSAIGNASNKPLPYPLVHVSLTDRWEEIIGSKVLEPSEYLAGDLDPRKPVAPNDRFQAVIAIESPSAEATGFKLNVCYRTTPGRVRCATEDFKN